MKSLIPDFIAIVGMLLLAAGLYLVSLPLSLGVSGFLLMAFGLLVAKRDSEAGGIVSGEDHAE